MRKKYSLRFFSFKKRKWKKILYEDQDYADNYVHNSFLSSLLTNFGIKYKYSHVCHSMLCINHQIMIVLFLLISYYCIDKNVITQKLFEECFRRHYYYRNNMVLISLTQTHSDNTVYLVSIMLLLIHLMFHKYGFIYEKNENIDIFDATSLSCVVIASVILGSRLASIEQVFSFLFVSSILFFYSPFIFQTIALKNINYYNYVLFPFLFVILSLCIRSISITLFYVNLIGQFFLLFIVPAFFVKKHNLKTKLEGPWDICGVPSSKK
ncbi:hypothetical protein PFBG_02444 [Plasmodium falciparum 7G8]|uniref:Phosphatidylinositol N-acetylglucosaminyltransferase n=1 Tax=Plasmodium falciparum (isolate 7G8) TaxID=57266 RepID=W7F848_PLAF8|nr:hypothetical protein PFBG_02444 [Plasmodium falciparum 7G8]